MGKADLDGILSDHYSEETGCECGLWTGAPCSWRGPRSTRVVVVCDRTLRLDCSPWCADLMVEQNAGRCSMVN